MTAKLSYLLFATLTALLGIAAAHEAAPPLEPTPALYEVLNPDEPEGYAGALGVDTWTAPLNGTLTHNVGEVIAADGSTSFAIPKWDPAHSGTLTKVTLTAKVRFVPPAWYTGSEPYGAAFECEDVSDNGNAEVCRWGYDGCPPSAGQSEGDIGGPWAKVKWGVGGVNYVSARIETGLVEVWDSYDPFGHTTVELKAKDDQGEDSWETTTDLARWIGSGNILWTGRGTYGGNNTCSSSGASFIGGWETEALFSVAYTYDL